jgi:hypothetical protein
MVLPLRRYWRINSKVIGEDTVSEFDSKRHSKYYRSDNSFSNLSQLSQFPVDIGDSPMRFSGILQYAVHRWREHIDKVKHFDCLGENLVVSFAYGLADTFCSGDLIGIAVAVPGLKDPGLPKARPHLNFGSRLSINSGERAA